MEKQKEARLFKNAQDEEVKLKGNNKKTMALQTGFENVLKEEKKEFDGYKKEVSKMYKKLEKI